MGSSNIASIPQCSQSEKIDDIFFFFFFKKTKLYLNHSKERKPYDSVKRSRAKPNGLTVSDIKWVLPQIVTEV